MPRHLTLGWFTNYLVPDWTGPWSGDAGTRWADGSFAVDLVKQLERAGIDFVMLEDSTALTDVYGGTFEHELRWTPRAPKHDPLPLVSRLALETDRIGLVATASTTFYPPFLLARLLATLDHLTHGRVGWNIVTSTGDRAAQNFGMDAIPAHDERYRIAEEFVDVALQLWNSGESGTLPMPQGRPVLCQAGASPAGISLAARVADLVVAAPKGIDAMRDYRDRLRAAAEVFGRDPDDIRVLYMVTPILGETMAEAEAKAARYYEGTDAAIHRRLIMLSGDIDFSSLDLDAPIPDDLVTNGSTSILDNLRKWAAGRTIRETVSAERNESVRLVGTPESVADEMERVADAVGGDGFLFFGGGGGVLTRRYVTEICDGLIPVLRRRGIAATGYRGDTFRQHLAVTPATAHTEATV